LQAAHNPDASQSQQYTCFLANALRVSQIHFGEAISSQDLFLFAPLTLRIKQRCFRQWSDKRTFCYVLFAFLPAIHNLKLLAGWDAKSTKKIPVC